MSFLYFFDLLGTFVFAISGALLGVKKQLDAYGSFILALAVAVGGGTIRDMMLGLRPFVLRDPNYLICTLIAVVLVAFYSRIEERGIRYITILDAIGLGVFTVIGATKAINADLEWYAVIFLATLTGTGGGMIKDIMASEIPMVLKKEIYASAVIVGAIAFLFLHKLNIPENINALITSIVVTAIRLITLKNNLHLPKIRQKDS